MARRVDLVKESRMSQSERAAYFRQLHTYGTPEDGPAFWRRQLRSSQTFLVEVVARLGSVERRAVASGRDIYAITAPLVVEATERVVRGLVGTTGVLAPGEAFDARDFLRSLSPAHLELAIQ